MEAIEVYSDGTVWCAWHKGALGVKVRALFGTDVLPTAYFASASADVVVSALRRLNPGVDVRIARAEGGRL